VLRVEGRHQADVGLILGLVLVPAEVQAEVEDQDVVRKGRAAHRNERRQHVLRHLLPVVRTDLHVQGK